jgi:4-amino-4-deoxy-L-arabinose transferase-like glycosyltransferase
VGGLSIGSSGRLGRFVIARRTLIALVAIVASALAMRLAFAFRVPVFLLHDSASYYVPAHDLVHGLGFDLSIRRTPLYPWFLAGTVGWIGEDLLAVAIVQHLTGIGIALGVFFLGHRLLGYGAGLVAGFMTAIDGTLLVSEHYVMPETLLTGAFLAFLATCAWCLARPGWQRSGVAGLVLGLCILCKPVAQVLIPLLPLSLWFVVRDWRRWTVGCLAFGLGAVVVLAPWALRNLAVHGSLTTSGALGQTLIARTAKHDWGFRYFDASKVSEYGDSQRVAARRIVQNGISQRLSDGVIYRRIQDQLRLSDSEISQFARNLALEVILAQPWYYVRGTLSMTWTLLVGEVEKLRTDFKTQNARLSRDEWPERVEHLLSRPTESHHVEFEKAADVVDVFQPAALGPLLPLLALVGTVLAALTPGARIALLLPFATLAVLGISAALDGPVVRYRYPVDPLIALMAAYGALALPRIVHSTTQRLAAITKSGWITSPARGGGL